MTCFWVIKGEAEWVRQVVCGTVEDHGIRLIKTVRGRPCRSGICACVHFIYLILEHA